MSARRRLAIAAAVLGLIATGLGGVAPAESDAASIWWNGNASVGRHWHSHSGYTTGTDVSWPTAWYTNVGGYYCASGTFVGAGSNYAAYQWRALNSSLQVNPWFMNQGSVTYGIAIATTDSGIGRPECHP